MNSPLDNDFLAEAAQAPHQDDVPLPVPELSPRYVYKPPPPPKPLLDYRPFAHEAPQPARLAAIQAAPVPLMEAAQPLLRILADMPQALEVEEIAAFQQQLKGEIANFQSVCVEARMLDMYIVCASYALCSALDEAANFTPWGHGADNDPGVWANHQLAAHFHGDTQGGEKVYRMLRLLIDRLQDYPDEVDPIELFVRIIRLGFEGICRGSPKNRRALEGLWCRGDDAVRRVRNEAADLAYQKLNRVPDREIYTPYRIPDSFWETGRDILQIVEIVLVVAMYCGAFGHLFYIIWQSP